MNTAIYEWGDYDTVNDVVFWTDITNYVMASGDFNIIFNNFDGTMKETEFNITVNAEWDMPYIIKNKPFRIKQDGKVLFYGYIHAIIDRMVNDSERDLVIRSVLSRLSDTHIDNLSGNAPSTSDVPRYPVSITGGGCVDTGTLIEWYFLKPGGWQNAQQPIGIVKVEVDATALNLYCPNILYEPLFSAGSDVVSAFYNMINPNQLYSWKEIIEIICYMGFILIWDIENERFKFIYTGTKDDGIAQTIYTSPVDAKIYKVEKETLNMIRTMTINSKWCSDWSQYSAFITTGELDSEVQSTLTVNSAAESLDLGDCKSVLFVNSDRTALVHASPKSYWNRFSLVLDFFTLTTDIVTDVAGAETDYTCLFNVSSYDAKLVNGRYFGELQLFDITTGSLYSDRDDMYKELQTKINSKEKR